LVAKIGLQDSTGSWSERYSHTLLLFLFPPLLLIMTGLGAVHGTAGTNDRAAGRWFSYLLALVFRVCRVKCLKLAWSGWCSVQQAHLSAARHWGRTGRILDTTVLFSALSVLGAGIGC